MPTPIGTNTITSLVDRFLLPQIIDNVYNSNPLIFRIMKANKKIIQGGAQIEAPIMLSDFTAGGFYQGLDLLNMVPQDTVKTAAWGWKQAFVPLVFDGLTLLKTDSPQAIANIIQMQSSQAQMKMAEVLGTAIYGDGITDPKSIDGLRAVIDDGTIAATYGGLSRTTYTNWKASRDSSTATLTLAALNTAFGNALFGGRSPSVIVSRHDQYNRYWNLAYTGGSQAVVTHSISGGAVDEQMFSACFHNILFNGVPWVVDSHVQNGSTASSQIFMVNEDFGSLVVSPRADMYMEDFQTPIGQDAASGKLLWAGNYIHTAPRTCALLNAVNA